MALFANLTLLPGAAGHLRARGLLATGADAGAGQAGDLGRVAGRVVGRPVLTLVVGLVILVGLALSLLAYSPTGFGSQTLPATSDSARGPGAPRRPLSGGRIRPHEHLVPPAGIGLGGSVGPGYRQQRTE